MYIAAINIRENVIINKIFSSFMTLFYYNDDDDDDDDDDERPFLCQFFIVIYLGHYDFFVLIISLHLQSDTMHHNPSTSYMLLFRFQHEQLVDGPIRYMEWLSM